MYNELQVRYEERGAREEEWLCLAKCRFSWQSDLPPGSHPNPTFVPGLTPSGHEAVEHKVLARETNGASPRQSYICRCLCF